MLTAIVAIDCNNVVGLDGSIPWECKSDRKFFKDYVGEKWKICGSYTWSSIHKYKWAKDVIVYSRLGFHLACEEYDFNGEWKTSSIEHLNRCSDSPLEYVVIGGAQIYELAAPYVSALYVTRIDRSTCNPARATIFPWKSYMKYNWIENHHKELEEGVNVYKLTRNT